MSVLRRMMMGGFNIDAFPSSRKIYYTASERVLPNNNSLGSKVQLNMYDTSTMNGVIVTVNDITSIGDDAFAYRQSLTSVNIPDSVTTIGYRAFQECKSLTSVNIPNSVTEIRDYAFSTCKLTSVNIPDSVTAIGYKAFYFCTSLAEFTGKFTEDNGRILVVNGVLTAFAPASITEYNIPDSVTTIGSFAFENCDSLTSVTIPDSVTTIGDRAFYNCDGLTSIIIPDSVTTIGTRAFEYCRSLTSVYCKATTPPVLDGTNHFAINGSGRKFYVPTGSVEAYKSETRWSYYASAIEGYEF